MQESIRSPFFTIIIPTKDRLDLLSLCIQSILNQTFSNFEVIIVDDHSQDNTVRFLASLSDLRLVVIKNKMRERSAARNTGIQNAKGKYICFIDDDDFVAPQLLQDYYDYLQASNFPMNIVLRTGFKKYYHDLKNIPTPLYSEKIHKNAINYAAYNMCGVWSLCIPAQCLEALRFDERFPHWQDTYFILRLLMDYQLLQLPQYNYFYRMHSAMGSQQNDAVFDLKQKAAVNVAAIEDFFTHYQSNVNRFLPQHTRSFLIAEKWIQYAIRMCNISRRKSLEMAKASISNGIFLRNWKYYILFIKQYFIPE